MAWFRYLDNGNTAWDVITDYTTPKQISTKFLGREMKRVTLGERVTCPNCGRLGQLHTGFGDDVRIEHLSGSTPSTGGVPLDVCMSPTAWAIPDIGQPGFSEIRPHILREGR